SLFLSLYLLPPKGVLPAGGSGSRLVGVCGCLPRLNNVLEVPQRLLELLYRERLEELGKCHASNASGRSVCQSESYLSATGIRQLPQVHCAGIVHVCPRQGTPR